MDADDIVQSVFRTFFRRAQAGEFRIDSSAQLWQLLVRITVLKAQHQAGRKVTDLILRNADKDQFRKDDARKEVVRSCEAFIRMYRPHEAREDTVLFPALYTVMPARRVREPYPVQPRR